MTKKIEKSIEQTLATKNETYQKLCTVSAEVSRTARILKHKKDELQTATRSLEDFKKDIALRQRSTVTIIDVNHDSGPGHSYVDKFYENSLNEQEKGEYTLRQERIVAAEFEINSTSQKLDTLRDEERSLRAELFESGDDLKEALLFQQKLNNLDLMISGIVDAISKQQTIIKNANHSIPSIDALLRKREDVLAEIAVGNLQESAREEIDRKIEAESEKVSGAKGGAKAATELAQQTIVGLQRKLSPLQDEVKALKEQRKGVLTRFLISEAEKVGAEYALFAEKIVACFRQLNALDNIITSIDSSSIIGYFDDFVIPRFQLQGHEGEATAGWFFEGLGIFSSIRENDGADLEAEKERIAGLGIVI